MAHEQNLQEPDGTTLLSEEEIRAGVCAAQWFVINAAMTLDEALSALQLTRAQFEQYKDMPES